MNLVSMNINSEPGVNVGMISDYKGVNYWQLLVILLYFKIMSDIKNVSSFKLLALCLKIWRLTLYKL